MKTRTIASGILAIGLIVGSTAAWAGQVVCRVDVDRTVLPAGTKSQAVLKVTVEAGETQTTQKRTPVNLAIVLDRSGSMGGAKIEHAREAAIQAIRRLHPQDIVSLVTYDSGIETVIPAQHPTDVERLEALIRNITPRGMTALFGGVSQGASELRKHQDERYFHRMILLSDGQANVGPSQPADLGRLGASLLKENIHVSTVGVGMGFNEDLMTALARESGGNTHFVEDSSDLARIITSELGEAQQTVARSVTIHIELPDGVEPVRIIGREGRMSHGRVEVPVHALQGGQSRYALIEVTVPPHVADHTLELAKASASYDDLSTRRRETTTSQSIAVTFSPEQEKVEASIVPAVERTVLDNRMAVAQDEAIRLADEGRRQEAAAVVRQVAQEYERVGRRDGNDDMIHQANTYEVDADRLEEVGMDGRQRKSYRANSFQTINQQMNQ